MTERPNKTPAELQAIFDSLNVSEKFGLAFGLFPARLSPLTKDDAVALMDLRVKASMTDRKLRTNFDREIHPETETS